MYKKKKSRLWIGLLLLILGVAAGGIWGYHKSKQKEETKEEEIVVQENQTLVSVRITRMLGNEMTGNIVSEENKSEGEQQIWMIPVGTQVVTKLGTTTTFERLSNGDTIQMLMQAGDGESEDILKIWIMQ